MFMWLASWPASQLTVLHGQNFNIGHDMQAVQQNVFIPAMLVGIDSVILYHFH